MALGLDCSILKHGLEAGEQVEEHKDPVEGVWEHVVLRVVLKHVKQRLEGPLSAQPLWEGGEGGVGKQ